MNVKPEGKRKKGRPIMRWTDGVEQDLRNLGVVNWKIKHKNGMVGERGKTQKAL
jgi:hypothetical protein